MGIFAQSYKVHYVLEISNNFNFIMAACLRLCWFGVSVKYLVTVLFCFECYSIGTCCLKVCFLLVVKTFNLSTYDLKFKCMATDHLRSFVGVRFDALNFCLLSRCMLTKWCKIVPEKMGMSYFLFQDLIKRTHFARYSVVIRVDLWPLKRVIPHPEGVKGQRHTDWP